MKRLWLALLFLISLTTFVHAAFFDRDDCDEIPSNQRVANGTMCLQRTTTAGRTAGRVYIWNGTVWGEIVANATSAGSSGDLQYNNGAGGMGAESVLNYNPTNDILSIPSLTVGGGLKLTGDIEPAQITSDQDNYAGCNVGSNSVCRVSTDANRNITGISGGSDGVLLFFYNQGSNQVTLSHQGPSSSASNRFDIGTTLTLTAGQGLILQYDAIDSVWRAASGVSGGAAPGGGGSFSAITSGTNTSAAMIVGTGGSLTTSGSGTIAATTATQLSANPANCAAGQFAAGINASGVPEGCTALPTSIAGTTNQITASASTGAITLSIPSSPTLPGTTSGTFSGTFAGPLAGNITSSGQSTFSGSLLLPGKADPGSPVTNEFWRSTTVPVGLKYFDGSTIQRDIKDSDFAGSGAGLMNRIGAGTYSIMAPTANTVYIGNGTLFQGKVIPQCNASTQGLQYDQGTGDLTCGNPGVGGLTGITEDADSVNVSKIMEVGLQTNNVALVRGGNIVGNITYTMNRNVNSEVAVTTGTLTTDDNLKFAASGAIVRGGTSNKLIQFIIGAENGVALIDGDDQPTIFANRYGQGITINEVWCESDAGTPSINLQRDDGSPANILSSNLSCSTAGASTTTFVAGENLIANGSRIDFLMVAAGGVAKRITVSIRYTLD